MSREPHDGRQDGGRQDGLKPIESLDVSQVGGFGDMLTASVNLSEECITSGTPESTTSSSISGGVRLGLRYAVR